MVSRFACCECGEDTDVEFATEQAHDSWTCPRCGAGNDIDVLEVMEDLREMADEDRFDV